MNSFPSVLDRYLPPGIERIAVFPQPGMAESVLAVDLDEASIEKLRTYPGRATDLYGDEVIKLADDLRTVGVPVRSVPGLVSALRSYELFPGEETPRTTRPDALSRSFGLTDHGSNVVGGLIGLVAFSAMLIWPLHSLIPALFPEGLPGGGFSGFLARWAPAAALSLLLGYLTADGLKSLTEKNVEKKRSAIRAYRSRFNKAAPQLLRSEWTAHEDLKSAFEYVEAVDDGLVRLQSYGLSTGNEANRLTEQLDIIIRVHMKELHAKATIDEYATVLRSVDDALIEADADLGYVREMMGEQTRTFWESREAKEAALKDLDQLAAEVSKDSRAAEARLQAARLRNRDLS